NHLTYHKHAGDPLPLDDGKDPDDIEALFDIKTAPLRNAGRKAHGPHVAERRNEQVTDLFRPLPFVELYAIHGRHGAEAGLARLWNTCRAAGIDDAADGLGVDGPQRDPGS